MNRLRTPSSSQAKHAGIGSAVGIGELVSLSRSGSDVSGDESESSGWRTPGAGTGSSFGHAKELGAGAGIGGGEGLGGGMLTPGGRSVKGKAKLGEGEPEAIEGETFENVKVHPPKEGEDSVPGSGAASSYGSADDYGGGGDGNGNGSGKGDGERERDAARAETVSHPHPAHTLKREDEREHAAVHEDHLSESNFASSANQATASASATSSKTHSPRASVDASSTNRRSMDLKHLKAKMKETVKKPFGGGGHSRDVSQSGSEEELKMPGSFSKERDADRNGGGNGSGEAGDARRTSVRGDDLLVSLLKRFKLR